MQRPEDAALSRERPFDPKRTCLLLIDTQNYVWNEEVARRLPEFDETVRSSVLPNLQRLIAGFREAGGEVMYTVMENLTRDGRDRSLDYKLSNFFIAKGSWEAKVLRRAGARRRRHRPSEDLVRRLQLDQHRVPPAQYRHRHAGDHRLPHRPVRRPYGAGRGGSGVLSRLRRRRLRHAYPGSAPQRPRRLRRLLPHADDRRASCRAFDVPGSRASG